MSVRLTLHFKEHEVVQHRCGYTLLRRVAGKTTMHYQYRDAQAGPDSQPLTVCPKCSGVLDIGNVRGEVVESAEKMMEEYKSDLEYLEDR